MRRSKLVLVLLFVACFALAAYLQPREAAREPVKTESVSALGVLLGGGKEIVAARMFAKADAYFHLGKYPSIFEQNAQQEENHMAGEAHSTGQGDDAHEEEERKVVPPRDWIEAFGRRFVPNKHIELAGEDVREMLPWLELSAELDPTNTETYAVGAYWLRKMQKTDEAEQFVREGLKHNPNAPDLLYVLGDIYFQERKDLSRAKNIWIAAMRRWHETEGKKDLKEQNKVLLEQILSGLEHEELEAGHPQEALQYLQQLKEVSPSPEDIQQQIDELTAKIRSEGAESKTNRSPVP